MTGTGAMQLRHLDSGAVLVRFAQPVQQITMNQRTHWTKRSNMVRAWRTTAGWAARALKVEPMGPCTVTVRLEVRGNTRRDPHNWMPTAKAIVDGLVDAGVWPDDTPEHVTVHEPELIRVATPTYLALHAEVLLTPRAAGPAPEVDDEVRRLRRWKHEALEVLNRWDDAFEASGIDALPGDRKPDVLLATLRQLRQELNDQRILVAELLPVAADVVRLRSELHVARNLAMRQQCVLDELIPAAAAVVGQVVLPHQSPIQPARQRLAAALDLATQYRLTEENTPDAG